MLIEKINADYTVLTGKTIIITGGGGGIAAEAGKALAYLGANVILSELDEQRGLEAQNYIGNGWKGSAVYHPLDLTDSQSISRLYEYVMKQYGCADVIIHNAVVTPFDSVELLPVTEWDKSYLVHLRGPIELTQKFLPHMKNKNSGTIVFIPSTGAVPFMGAYEVFKNAQVILANTLAAELENTGIHVFSIGPGLVKTKTAMAGIEKAAPMMGITADEFYSMNAENTGSVEEAGTAFAVSLLFAQKYHGTEIGRVQALVDAGIVGADTPVSTSYAPLNEQVLIQVVKAFNEQFEGWSKRKLFERQWVLRDFKKQAGHSADEVLDMLNAYISAYPDMGFDEDRKLRELLASMRVYYVHQIELTQGHIKDTKTREEWIAIIKGWIDDVDTLLKT